MKYVKRVLSVFITCVMLLALCGFAAYAAEPGQNLVFGNGTFDNILKEGEQERTLNSDWVQSYPVATFGGSINSDSPAIVRNVDGNPVVVLQYSTGTFASYFADLYASGEMLPAGTYELSMDLKPVGDAFSTDNVGFNLYNQYHDIRIYDNGWHNCTELADGWLHYSQIFEISADSVDSIQMWFNTMGLPPAQCALYIDNLSFAAVEDTPEPTPGPTEPEQKEMTVEYTVNSGTAITVTLPQETGAVTVAELAGYTLEEGLDYHYTDGVITMLNEYADGLSSGETQIMITTDGAEYLLRLVIKNAKPALPDSQEGYLMQETLVGGDFEMFEEELAFTMEQIEGWGSNISYDDPGVIVTRDGSKVLRLQKDQKSSYSSAFAFISPTIQAGDVLTLGFDYLLDVEDAAIYQGADINFCFVSASNMQMCLIPLDGSRAAQTRGDGDYQWDVRYTDKENGWVRVEMTFVANTALLSYNSMRFLLPTDRAAAADALYIDNVSLVLWAEPEAPEAAFNDVQVFDKGTPADMFVLIDLKALDPQKITCDGQDVDPQYWSVNPSKDTITFAKEYLALLENGEHEVTVQTKGGSCSVTVRVEGEASSTDDPAADLGTDWIWIVIAAVAAAAVIAAVVIVLRVKKGKRTE